MSSNEALFTAGDYEIRLVEVMDARLPATTHSSGRLIPATSAAYGIYHKPSGVLNGTSTMFSAAIRGAWALNEELKKALENPGDDDEFASRAPRGFG